MAANGVKYEAAYEAGTLVSDASAVAACAAAVRASGSGCELMTSASRTFTGLAECEAAFVGKVPVGGSCLVTEECEGSAYVECRDSVCREFPPGEEGDPCIMTERPGIRAYPNSAVTKDGARCRTKDGLYCAYVSATLNRCAPIKADGAACTDAYSCGEESYCDGTCKPLKAIGQSCKSSLECLGLGCDPDSSKCTDVMPQAACEAASD